MCFRCIFYLEYLHHHLLIVGNVDCLKDFTVLATPELSHQLKVILISVRIKTKKRQQGSWGTEQPDLSCVWLSTRYLPPFDHVGLVVPVLPGPVCVDLGVHAGPARHGSWHVRQLGGGGEEPLLPQTMVGRQGGREGGGGGKVRGEGGCSWQGKGVWGALAEGGGHQGHLHTAGTQGKREEKNSKY